MKFHKEGQQESQKATLSMFYAKKKKRKSIVSELPRTTMETRGKRRRELGRQKSSLDPFWDAPDWFTLDDAGFSAVADMRKYLQDESRRKAIEVRRVAEKDLQKMRQTLMGMGPSPESFGLGNADSDKVSEIINPTEYLSRGASWDAILEADIEILFSSSTLSNVDRWDTKRYRKDSIFKEFDSYWLGDIISANMGNFITDLSKCNDSLQYSTHMKSLVHLEVHYYVQKELAEKFPGFKDPTGHIAHDVCSMDL